MKWTKDALIVALALMAAVIATGLLAGWSMWAWIVAYWLTLTLKNTLDIAERIRRDD